VKVQKLLPLFLTVDFSAKDVNIFELFAKLHVRAQQYLHQYFNVTSADRDKSGAIILRNDHNPDT